RRGRTLAHRTARRAGKRLFAHPADDLRGAGDEISVRPCARTPLRNRGVRTAGLLAFRRDQRRTRISISGISETPGSLFQSHAAIDNELDTCDIAALVACKVKRGIGHIPGIAPEAHGDLPGPRLPNLLFAAIRRREPC